MSTKFSAFDPAEYLDSDEAIAAYMNEVIATGDDDLFLSALSDIARARGMSEIAQASGLGRESLYKALKPGAKPGFFTIAKVVAALGVNLRVAVKGAKPEAKKTAKTGGKTKGKVTNSARSPAHKRAA
ncbi:putative addiction module antidote protein [Dyella choica]|uniref:Putative addiction module antidote protein n=2 Tax=Dyella choica TaxID=1927959 RepID=A0A432M2I4_9GAMM|nr:putative addiction module antidote protein [Dyella choica]